MIDIKDIYWLAGFIEGEGCFQFHKKNHAPYITISQKDPQCLYDIKNIFGGSIHSYRDREENIYYKWTASTRLASGLMLTLYSLLSDRRKEKIKECITQWKNVPTVGHYKRNKLLICHLGHDLTNDNNIYLWRGKRRCKRCNAIRARIYRGKK